MGLLLIKPSLLGLSLVPRRPAMCRPSPLPPKTLVVHRVPTALRDYWKAQDSHSTDYGLVLHGFRIVIPAAARRTVLARLHDSHVESTKQRDRQTVWWTGGTSDIVNTVQSCDECQTLLSSQIQEPLLCDLLPTRPVEDVSADLFSHAGKNFLLCADRLSAASCWEIWKKYLF